MNSKGEAFMNITDAFAATKPHRLPRGYAAALLPFAQDGGIAEDAYAAHLVRTRDTGLVNAVNMDTGYVNLLGDEQKRRVLALAREALGASAPLVAGVYIERKEGEDVAALYRREIETIQEFGATPILFQTARLHGRTPAEKAAVYREAVRDVPEAFAFELGKMFAPNGEIFDLETVSRIMEIPQFTGMKHSSLDRVQELERLALRDQIRPEFAIFTGNDLGIDMIMYGSDYLLGLAAFAPEKFAERDRAWRDGDAGRYFSVNDALQNLGNIAFRPPVPAYKHSAAVFLHLLRLIPTNRTHPDSLRRPEWEAEIMRSCAERLGLV